MAKNRKAKPEPKDRRRRRADLLVEKLLDVDDLKKASGWGPACRACAYAKLPC